MVTTSGSMPCVLEGEPAPGAAEAGLDLVDHEEQAALVHRSPARRRGSPRRRHDARLALDRLEQHGGDAVRVDRPASAADVAVGDVAEPLGQGQERLVLGGLARGVQSGQRAAVERAVAPIRRTWRPGPPQRRASLIAHSFASAPELAKNTCPPARRSRRRSVGRWCAATSSLSSLPKRFETWSSRPAWAAIASATDRVGVAERR